MIVVYCVFCIWFVRILVNTVAYVQLWYTKEYRVDRMRIHLRTKQGKMIFFPKMRRPPVTPKTISMISIACVCYAIILYVLPYPIWVRFLIVDAGSFVFVSVMAIAGQIPTYLYHNYVISKAKKLLLKYHPPYRIGITGSYGKTSTKEYIATLLAAKYITLKTDASKNSPIGIAEVVLRELSGEHKAFVAEMGAYKRGEIAHMCSLVRPEIGVLTAINPQHQDLFGSIEETVRAKYELVQGLVGKKIVIVNYDNSYTQAMGKRAASEGYTVYYYSIHKKVSDFYAFDIQQRTDGVYFSVTHKGKTVKTHAPVFGVHSVSNILASIAVAVSCEIPFVEAVKNSVTFKPFEKTMQPVESIFGAECVDDTFNNNPDAAIAAISYLKTKGTLQKILVFQPMIELGTYAYASHVSVGKYASDVCDVIVLTNDLHYDAFMEGVKQSNRKVQIRVLSDKEAAVFVKKVLSLPAVILFKGKESSRVLAQLRLIS